jgi:hypothetical protein
MRPMRRLFGVERSLMNDETRIYLVLLLIDVVNHF